jgi:hypothetical protein
MAMSQPRKCKYSSKTNNCLQDEIAGDGNTQNLKTLPIEMDLTERGINRKAVITVTFL